MSDRTATRQIEMINLRLRRAQHLAAVLMQEIDDVMPSDFDSEAVYDRLLQVLSNNGASWTTDEDRAAHGLESRDDLGWTPSERIAQKQREARAMLGIMTGTVVIKDSDDQ